MSSVCFPYPSSPRLRVDLSAVVDNWRFLGSQTRAVVSAVVKADAYGLGICPVASALWDAGCRSFFVATLAEGAVLRDFLPEATVFVLNGPLSGEEADYLAHGLIPVLNDPAQVRAWDALARRGGTPLPAALHLDTGMARLGIAPEQLDGGLKDGVLSGLDLRLIMSHLSHADLPDDSTNRHQCDLFRRLSSRLPPAPLSLSASGGCLMGADYHFDLVRPGIGLYGGIARPDGANPFRPVVRAEAPILQLRDLPSGRSVGYGGTWVASRPTRVATVGLGYADGLSRALSNRGYALWNGQAAPLIGRVSMDLITLDVTDLKPDGPLGGPDVGSMVTLIGDDLTLDAVAERAGTIPYEILTSLGGRYHRIYTRV